MFFSLRRVKFIPQANHYPKKLAINNMYEILIYIDTLIRRKMEPRKSPKKLTFNISEDDHEILKKAAATKRTSMTLFVMQAVNEFINRNNNAQTQD